MNKKLIRKIIKLADKYAIHKGIMLISKKHWEILANHHHTMCVYGYPVSIYGLYFVCVKGLNKSPQVIIKEPILWFKGYTINTK